ncbi:MAG TPA: DUF5668 domain-containing protein [Candidatus Kapabacteria bacterium]|nr:DUF5668 domain-containing protein [Candidatus Kapabacteria bacterium]
MRAGRIFWGVFFVVIGGLLLLSKLNMLHMELGYLWKLWPLIFIFWGLSALTRSSSVKWLLFGITAVVAALFLFSAMHNGRFAFHEMFSDGGPVETQHNTENYDSSIVRATLLVEAGAGEYNIQDTTNSLIDAATQTRFGHYDFETNKGDSIEHVTLKMEGKSTGWHWGNMKNEMDMKLNTHPLWNMDFDLGAASMNMDLSPYMVGIARFDIGAASAKIKLGDRVDTSNIDIDAGASSIELSIPSDAGCQIVADASLSGKDFPDFTKTSDKTYRTANFDSAPKRIYINIDAGVSSLKVKRYSGGQ